MVNTAGAQLLGGRASSALDLTWQAKAWRFYGTPDGTAAAAIRTNQGAIGEARSVMGWLAQQIGRIHWDVLIDGEAIPQEQSNELMRKVANDEATIIIATNLIVAGELNYCAMPQSKLETLAGDPRFEALAGPVFAGDDDARWVPVSVVDNHRRELLAGADLNLRGIWPHPAKSTVPDPPFRAVIDVLEEIEQLQDLAYSQNRSRIAQMGILTVANEFDLAVPGGDFGARLEEAINAPIADPRKTSASPILLRGPFELMSGALSNGARGVQWTRPAADFDERLDEKMKFLIQRLAWGFPVAPEILLGMTATNRAVAFQVEESTYRSHIEPIARLVGRVYARALKMILDDSYKDKRVEVNPDATELLARRHSVADAKDLYDRGLVRDEFVRRVAGVAEEDKATEEDLARIVLLRKGGNPGQPRENDPSEVAGNEPVRASAGAEDLAQGLRAAISMAHMTAVMRAGAAARNRLNRTGTYLEPPLDLNLDLIANRQLPSMLGRDRLDQLGINEREVIRPAADQLRMWWEGQVIDASESFLDTMVDEFSAWCNPAICAAATPPADALVASIMARHCDHLLLSATEEGG